MADTTLDVEAALVQYLAGFGFTVYAGELPAGFDSSLPAVRVVQLPARELRRAWNGPGLLQSVDVDVDVFASNPEAVADVAMDVRRRLDVPTIGELVVTGIPAFHRKPDWNENIRRRGAVLSLVTR